MALETTSYVGGLVAANPTSTDPKSQGDDHLRLIKTALLDSFAGFPGMIIVTGTEAQGATASDYTLTVSPAPAAYTSPMLAVFDSTHANTGAATLQINALGTRPLLTIDGTPLQSGDIHLTGAVMAFYDGTNFYLISSNDRAWRHGDTYSGTHDFTGAAPKVPTQAQGDNSTNSASTAYVDTGLALKAPIASPTFTGIPAAPTPALGTNSTQLATTAFVVQQAFLAALPAQTGHGSGETLTTNGVSASWGAAVPLWVTGTTYAAGVTVSSPANGAYYRRKTAGAGTTDPSIDTANWASTSAFPSGAVITSPMSSNLVLTSSSKQVQTVAPNAAGLAIQLPDATTINASGAAVFQLNNLNTNGAFPVQVIDSAANVIGWVIPGARTLVHLDSNAAATGGWRLHSGDRSNDNGWYEWGAAYQTASYTFDTCIQLDAQYGIRIYGTAGGSIYAQGYKLSDTGTQFGTPSASMTTAFNTFDAVRLSATEVFLIAVDGTTTVSARTIDINTGTLAVTVNASATVDAASGETYCCVDAISSTLALVGWYNGTTFIKAATVSISAGTCTVNASATLASNGALANLPVVVTVLSPTLAHFAWSQTNSSALYFARVVLSGTSITSVSTPIGVSSRAAPCITKISATVSAAVYTDSASSKSIFCNILTDNGTTITGNEITLQSATSGPSTYAFALQPGIVAAFKSSGTAGGTELALIHASASGATMTPVLFTKNFAASNPSPGELMPKSKTYNNTGMFAMYISASADIISPICIA